jgi:hypothetical protein
MLRRVGYIVGWGFVLAYVAAYPLTWGRHAGAMYLRSGGWSPACEVCNGNVSFGVIALDWSVGLLWETRAAPVGWEYLYRMRYVSNAPFGRGGSIEFPLWMPAALVGLWMGWR